ncbi:transposase [Alkalispirochaeta odontotermitis]|nr:transposase [Alkalispirochaeta odontotermitis]
MVYLDTHVVVWLYAGLLDKVTDAAKRAIDESDLFVSQMARLELQYLFEIGRLKVRADTIIRSLSESIGLKLSEIAFDQIIGEALKLSWTRDVFDRLLVAEAKTQRRGFISADNHIQSNYKQTIW